MQVRNLFPANVLAAARLLRTKMVMRGWVDSQERTGRLATFRSLPDQSLPLESAPRILVFSLRGGWYPHAAWETLLAHALRARGAAIHVFNCGGPMPICEVNFRHASPALACAECGCYASHLTNAAKLESSRLRDYVSDDERRAIERSVDEIEPAGYPSWCFDGQPIGELVGNSVRWFLRKREPDLTSDDARVFRDFLIAGAEIACMAPKILARVRPDTVLELNGQFFAERIFNRYAVASSKIVIYEASWRTNQLGFDRFTERGPVDLDQAWKVLSNRPLSADEEHRLSAWSTERESGDMQRDSYIHFASTTGPNPIAGLGLRPELPTAVLFTNLVWDTAVLGRDLGFNSIEQWLLDTVALFDRWPGRQLVVRIHPAEDLRPSQESVDKLHDVMAKLGSLPSNVRVVSARTALSSYQLLSHSQVVLVYTSTIGLEAALRGVPVVVAAKVYYRDRGFTFDVESRNDYRNVIERAFSLRDVPETQKQAARRFAYLLLFRYLHEVPVLRQRPGTFPLFEPSEVHLLQPGGSPSFDRLMHALLRGDEFVDLSPAPEILTG